MVGWGCEWKCLSCFLEVEALAKFGSLKLGFFNGKQEQTFSF